MAAESEDFKCEYCDATFTSKGNLTSHQKRAKFCLQKRGLLSEQEDFHCLLCQKEFTRQHYLNVHLESCIPRCKPDRVIQIDSQIKQMEDVLQQREETILKLHAEIQSLNYKFQELASKPRTTVTNKTTNNFSTYLNLHDTDRLYQVLESITPNDLVDGQISLARFITENYLSDQQGQLMYRCVDSSRQNFVFQNEHGFQEKDVKCAKLTSALVKSKLPRIAFQKGEELWKTETGAILGDRMNFFQEKVLEVASIDKDNTKFTNELTKLTT